MNPDYRTRAAIRAQQRGARDCDKLKTAGEWIQRINDEGRNLTEWEIGWMESVTEQYESKGWLSERQLEILERIYAEKTS